MTQFLFPIKGSYRLTQRFGENLLNYQQFGLKYHDGEDFACTDGTPIVAPADGIIVEARGIDKPNVGGYGNHIRMLIPFDNDPNRFYEFIVAHLLTVTVKPGDKVVRGQVIGLSDNTGFSTNSHAHHGIRVLQKNNVAGYTTKVYLDNVYALIDYDNGVYGYVNPAPFFKAPQERYAVDDRYGQPYSAVREWLWKVKHEKYARQKALENGVPFDKRLVNAFVYGFHDANFVFDPAMFAVWRELTKPAYLKLIKTPPAERIDIIK